METGKLIHLLDNSGSRAYLVQGKIERQVDHVTPTGEARGSEFDRNNVEGPIGPEDLSLAFYLEIQKIQDELNID